MIRLAVVALCSGVLCGACTGAEPSGLDPGENDGSVADSTQPMLDIVEDISDVAPAPETTDVSEVSDGISLSTTDTSPPDASPEEVEEVEPCPVCAPSEASVVLDIDGSALSPALERTRDNPLKGFLTSYLWGEPANDLPDQMEFVYLPMADVWGASGETFDVVLEPLLVAAAERGHHLVLRVYIDYPNKPSGLPAYLAETVSCSPYEDHGGGCSPDYDDPLLVDAMVGLFGALGAAYDADPRLGVLQIGLLGFWGEWHTYPHPEWFPTLETQNAVLEAAHAAFSTTQLQVRRPAGDSVSLRIGFHDDSFAHSTLGDIEWFFWPSLVSAGADSRWQEVMMGGELRPELQGSIFEEGYVLDTYAQDFDTCVQTTHASYMLNYQAFNEDGTGYLGEERDHAEASALAMGYTFEITAASAELSGLDAGTVEAQIHIEFAQTGVAPFYYPVFPSLSSELNAELPTSPEDLRTLLPGETRTVTFSLGRVSTTLFQAPLEVHLLSDMLLAGQRIQLATQTPWTVADGVTALRWTVQCEMAGQSVSLGEVAAQTQAGCPCVCDVDGVLRTCDGAVCP